MTHPGASGNALVSNAAGTLYVTGASGNIVQANAVSTDLYLSESTRLRGRSAPACHARRAARLTAGARCGQQAPTAMCS